MATRTWTAAVNTDFKNVGNWTEGAYAVNGDTIVIQTETAPATNRPDTITDVFHFTVASGVTVTLDSWLNGALIGNVTINHASADVTLVGAMTGNVTVTAGGLTVGGNIAGAGTNTIAAAGEIVLSGDATVTGAVANAGSVQVETFDLICTGLFTNTGTVAGVAGSSIDFNGGVAGGGTWGGAGSGLTLVSTGDFNLTSATWDVGVDSTLTIDNTATVNLGTTDAIANLTLLAKPPAGKTVTLGVNCSVRGFTFEGAPTGILDGNSKTVTLGAGGFTVTQGTFATNKTLTVDLSGSTGTYTQTAGTIATGGVLNVTTGPGVTPNFVAAAYTALTKTGTAKINITMAASANIGWNTTTALIDVLTVNSGVTMTVSGPVVLATLAGAGTATIDINSRALAFWRPGANFWTFDGNLTATSGSIEIYLDADRTNAALIDAKSVPVSLLGNSENNKTLTADGGVSCGALTIHGREVTANVWVGLTISAGANLMCGAVTLGKAAATFCGKLVLNAGTHTLTSLSIAAGNTGTANAITYAGRVNVGGNQTWTGIAVTLAAGAVIKATAAVTIDGTLEGTEARTNNGADLFSDGGVKLLTIDYMPALAKPLRTWCGCLNGGHNADGAVVFHPGAPSALGLMGCGV